MGIQSSIRLAPQTVLEQVYTLENFADACSLLKTLRPPHPQIDSPFNRLSPLD
jgi:hypothetical protein